MTEQELLTCFLREFISLDEADIENFHQKISTGRLLTTREKRELELFESCKQGYRLWDNEDGQASYIRGIAKKFKLEKHTDSTTGYNPYTVQHVKAFKLGLELAEPGN